MSVTRRAMVGGWLALVGVVAGCSPGNVIVRTTSALTEANGVSLNGVSLNGVSLNGVSLNGVSLNGVSLNGVSLNGVSLNGVSLNGSELVGVGGFSSYWGTSMVGSTFAGQLSNGSSLPIRVDSARKDDGIWFYRISAYLDGGWKPLCPSSETIGVEAIALKGVWNYDLGRPGGGSWSDSGSSFTFACRGANLAKCVELGYKPWTYKNGYPLHWAHLACVRMMRADYCGDGTSYTVDGTIINLYDGVGVQYDSEYWDREAEWTPDGARCVEYRSERSGTTPACVYWLPDCQGSIYWDNPETSMWGAVLVSECPDCKRSNYH